MKVETITYKRTKNLGNYQSETMEAIASLGEEDLPEEVAEKLKSLIKNPLFPPEPEMTAEPDSF